MSTIAQSDIYFTQSATASPTPLETASAGGPALSSGKLPLVAWVAFVVALVVARLLWEYSE
jgi:hypothetical protein